jgi:hypothetical protein
VYKKLLLIVFSAFITIGLFQLSAGERPPENAKPLSEIVKTIEDQGYLPVTDISMDDRKWEVEAYKNGKARDLRVDPITARINSDRSDNDDRTGERPPENAMPLSEILKIVEDQGYFPITDASMDYGIWKIDAYKNGEARELRVDPITAQIDSDRSDRDDDDDDDD